MNVDQVMAELAARATESCRRTYLRHGAPEPVFGVRVGDLQPLRRKLRGRQDLALALYATGNADAMYLAGLIADGTQMTRMELDEWVAAAAWSMIAGSTIPGVAAEHPEALALAQSWMDSPREWTATAGWTTASLVVAVRPDDQLPLTTLAGWLDRVAATLASAPNRVRYAMNGYVISCGTYVEALGDHALTVARQLGEVSVDLGDTDCQVPLAEPYILKSRRGARVAPKRRHTRC